MYNKVCSVCQVEKSVDHFEKRNHKPTYRCKVCASQYHKNYYIKNADKLKNKTLEFRNNNPEYMKNWRKNNAEKVTNQKINWCRKNKYKINENERNRRKNDIEYKIKKNLRRRVNQTITRDCKSSSTLELLGCSTYDFLKYMESKFIDGMNWDNYGQWHIDHIKPCSSFDLTNLEQQKLCFHYSNLQPLWAKDNISKSDKII
jgi:hypothetical protein